MFINFLQVREYFSSFNYRCISRIKSQLKNYSKLSLLILFAIHNFFFREVIKFNSKMLYKEHEVIKYLKDLFY